MPAIHELPNHAKRGIGMSVRRNAEEYDLRHVAHLQMPSEVNLVGETVRQVALLYAPQNGCFILRSPGLPGFLDLPVLSDLSGQFDLLGPPAQSRLLDCLSSFAASALPNFVCRARLPSQQQ